MPKTARESVYTGTIYSLFRPPQATQSNPATQHAIEHPSRPVSQVIAGFMVIYRAAESGLVIPPQIS